MIINHFKNDNNVITMLCDFSDKSNLIRVKSKEEKK